MEENRFNEREYQYPDFLYTNLRSTVDVRHPNDRPHNGDGNFQKTIPLILGPGRNLK